MIILSRQFLRHYIFTDLKIIIYYRLILVVFFLCLFLIFIDTEVHVIIIIKMSFSLPRTFS